MTTFKTFGLLAASAAVTHASPSGLNNIPTADTAGHREGVIQWYSTFDDSDGEDHWAGFKTGFQPFGPDYRFEVGFDSHIAPGDAGPFVVQGKFAFQPWVGLPAFAIGTANLGLSSDDRDDAGQAFSYAVMTHDFEYFRAHLGYGVQHHNDTLLLGFDKTVKLFDRDLMLRTDIRQIDDEDRWLASAGFLYLLHKNFALESWLSQPTEDGPTSVTIKLDFIFRF
jgi:hypothetical protein